MPEVGGADLVVKLHPNEALAAVTSGEPLHDAMAVLKALAN